MSKPTRTWVEAAMPVGDAVVTVVPMAWERACVDIMEALGGRGKILRGVTDATKASQSFKEVWDDNEWETWVVGDDGTVYNPIAAFAKGPAADRKVYPFDDLVQRLILKRIERSTTYHCNLFGRFNRDGPVHRQPRVDEAKTWTDALMLPLMDKIGVIVPCKVERRNDGTTSLVATRRIMDGDLVAGYPVDALISQSSALLEYVSPLSTASRCGYKLSKEDEMDLVRAKKTTYETPFLELIKRGSLVGDGKGMVFALSVREPRDDTFYNAHAARTAREDFNALQIMLRCDVTKCTSHVMALAKGTIEPGEEIVIRASSMMDELDEIIDNKKMSVKTYVQESLYVLDMDSLVTMDNI